MNIARAAPNTPSATAATTTSASTATWTANDRRRNGPRMANPAAIATNATPPAIAMSSPASGPDIAVRPATIAVSPRPPTSTSAATTIERLMGPTGTRRPTP